MTPTTSQQASLLIEDIKSIVPAGATFILADQAELGIEQQVGDRKCLPFTEHDGTYYGPPENDDAAVKELETLRHSGARYFALAWPSFWWLEYYSGFAEYLRSRFQCRLENERLVVFDFSAAPPTAPSAAVSNTICQLKCGLKIHIDDPREFIQGTLARDGEFEPGVSDLVTRLLSKGDLFVDVGGNIGYFALLAASRGAQVRAFEPLPRLAAKLRRNVSLNKLESHITVTEAALSNRSGTASFYEARRADDGSHSLLAGVAADAIRPTEVRTMRLDDYLKDAGSPAPDLIKVDVEGAEALVLDGAANTLHEPSAPVWIFETGDRLANQLGESATSVIDRFRQRGYRVFRIAPERPVLTEVPPGKVGGQLSDYIAVKPGNRKAEVIFSLVNEALHARLEWLNEVDRISSELKTILGSEGTFVLVDEDHYRADMELEAKPVPFLGRDGVYYGPPEDDEIAIREFEILRQQGARFVVFAAPAFWWLDYYAKFARHLRSRFRCVLQNEHWVAFDLNQVASAGTPT